MSAVRSEVEVVLCVLLLGFFVVLTADCASALFLGRFFGPQGEMLTEMIYYRGHLGDFVGSVVTAVWLIILPLWVITGGATSGLWNWLPPFWPWGKTVKSKWGRWSLVAVMELVVILGVIC